MENDINDFIDAVQQQSFNTAKDYFDAILDAKLDNSLEQEKIAVADTIFNNAVESEEPVEEEEDFDELE